MALPFKIGVKDGIDFTKKKYLVVDDFSEFRKSVKKMIQSIGAVDVDDTGDGNKAVEMMSMGAYDIVLCDYNLGENKRDGSQILEEAKTRGLLKQSTVYIMVTAENTMMMVMGALEYKPDGYLAKPFTRDALLNYLVKLIKKKEILGNVEKLMQRKEYLKAISQINDDIQKTPQHYFELMRLKSEIHFLIGDYPSARQTCEEVLEKDTNIPWALYGLANSYYKEEDLLEAKEILEDIIEKNKLFVDAYDLLSKTLHDLGDMDKAQKTLEEAIKYSPKAILRQKALGELSLKNGDIETAEKSFKKVITMGKTSYFKDPSNYTNLAKVYISTSAPEKALEALDAAEKEFEKDLKKRMQVLSVQSVVYKQMDNEEKAKELLDEALNTYNTSIDSITGDAVLDLASACLEVGDTEKGKEIVLSVVKNNFDDDRVVNKVQDIFNKAGIEDVGKNLIANTKKELAQLNNKGVQLAKQGKYKEAIEFFKKAVRGIPQSKVVNANAAQVMLMYMQKSGKDQKLLYNVKRYLDTLAEIDPTYQKYQQLLKLYETISSG